MSSRNDGGQRRTVNLPCSKTIIGTPREVNGKMNIHIRHCAVCKAEGIAHNASAKISHNGINNGWNGVVANRNLAPIVRSEQEMSIDGFSVTTPSHITDSILQVKQKTEEAEELEKLMKRINNKDILVINDDDSLEDVVLAIAKMSSSKGEKK